MNEIRANALNKFAPPALREIALALPGYGHVADNPLWVNRGIDTVGGLVTTVVVVAFYIAGILLFCWLVWGIFQYIFAGGSKEQLANARKRIIFAIVGFVFVLVAFTVNRFFSDLLPHTPAGGVTNVSEPAP